MAKRALSEKRKTGRGTAPKSGLKKARQEAVAALKLAEANAFRESIWRAAADAAGHGVWSYEVDHSGPAPVSNVVFASDAWFRLRGASPSQHELHDLSHWIGALHPDDCAMVEKAIMDQMSGRVDFVSIEYRERKPDGSYVWIMARGVVTARDAAGRPTRVTGLDIDITAIKDAEAERARISEALYLRHLNELREANRIAEELRAEAQRLAHTDTTTGMANRRMFREAVNAMIAQGAPFAVLQIDLDRFKPINDVHGHAAGDLVLRTAAARITAAAGENLCARLGGDEFAVLLKLQSPGDTRAVELVGARIIARVSEPVQMADLRLQVGASIGVAAFPRDAASYDGVLQRADMALYSIKHGERGTLRFYCQEMGEAAEEKAAFEADLRVAIHHGAIEPWFQPVVCARSGRVAKVEVLARWRCPLRGLVAPARFIPVAGHLGLLPELSTALMRKAMKALTAFPEVKLSINLSAMEAWDHATPVRILNALMKSGFPPERLEVEMKEEALVADLAATALVLRSLRNAGIKAYVDDFGEGVGGIGYLRQLEVDGLKIDRNCVTAICSDARAADFLASVQMMAVRMGYDTVAEGIETPDVWAKVREMGLGFGQGFLFSAPVPEQALSDLLNAARPERPSRVVPFART